MIVLKPSYYTKFECIGAECEDSCCKGWGISVDKASYKKYSKLKPSKFKLRLEDGIKRVKGNTASSVWATIKLKEDKSCPFLNECNLCDIYKELGESYMPKICRSYPRVAYKVEDRREFSLTTSCIEASRLVLSNKDGIDFILEDVEVKEDEVVWSGITGEGAFLNSSTKYFTEIREFSIDVIQERRLSIEDRLVVLGLFFKRVDTAEDVNLLIDTTRIGIREGLYDGASTNLAINELFQFKLLTGVYDILVNSDLMKSSYYTYLNNELKSGIGKVEEGKVVLDIDKYTKAKQEYKLRVVDYSYMLENYIVNYMLSKLFPLNESTMYKAYINLIVNVGVLKLHLIGLIKSRGDLLCEEDIIKAVSGYSHVVNHNNLINQVVSKYIEMNDLSELKYVLSFII